MNNSSAKPTICFVVPPSLKSTKCVPISYLFLAGWLRHNNHAEAWIIDPKDKSYIRRNATRNELTILNELSQYEPDYVGFTCFTSNFDEIIKLSSLIKEHIPTRIVVGGIHPTLRPHDFLYSGSPIDLVVIGDGEKPLSNIIEADLNNQDYTAIKGLAYQRDGQGYCNTEIESVDPASYRRLPYELLDMEFYVKPGRNLIRNLPLSCISIMTSRGCPFKCTFCASRQRKTHDRPLDQIMEEIKFLKATYGVDAFNTLDDTFCLNKKRGIEFCQKLLEGNLKMVWGIQTRANLIDDDYLALLKKAGCIQIDFGVESASQDILDRIQKQVSVEDMKNAFSLCRKHGIRTFANLMLNLPDETKKDVQETIRFIEQSKPSVTSVLVTVPFIGTKMYEDYVLKKRRDIEKDEYYIYATDDNYRRVKYDFFKLAKHDLNLERIKTKLNTKYNRVFDFSFRRIYLETLIRSKRKAQYLQLIIKDLLSIPSRLALQVLRHIDLWLSIEPYIKKRVRHIQGEP